MKITMTELKEDLKKYIEISKKEDVFITKNGKTVARLVGINEDKGSWVDDITGIASEEGLDLGRWYHDERKGEK